MIIIITVNLPCSPPPQLRCNRRVHSPSLSIHPALHLVSSSDPAILCWIFRFFPMFLQLVVFFTLSSKRTDLASWPHVLSRCAFFYNFASRLLLPLLSWKCPLPPHPSRWNIPIQPSRLLLETFLKAFLAGINISLFSTSITIFFCSREVVIFYTLLKLVWTCFISLDRCG